MQTHLTHRTFRLRRRSYRHVYNWDNVSEQTDKTYVIITPDVSESITIHIYSYPLKGITMQIFILILHTIG